MSSTKTRYSPPAHHGTHLEYPSVRNFIVTAADPSLFAVQPAVSAGGTLTYTPAANVVGSTTVSVKLHDDGGTANGGVDTSATQSFTFTIGAVNQAPSFTKGPDQTVLEDSGSKTVTPWATNISAGPANARFWLEYARIARQRGLTRRAERAVRRALELSPDYAEARDLLHELVPPRPAEPAPVVVEAEAAPEGLGEIQGECARVLRVEEGEGAIGLLAGVGERQGVGSASRRQTAELRGGAVLGVGELATGSAADDRGRQRLNQQPAGCSQGSRS